MTIRRFAANANETQEGVSVGTDGTAGRDARLTYDDAIPESERIAACDKIEAYLVANPGKLP